MNKDIMICGVGGQGTVLASRIIAASAMDLGHAVRSAETIGMAQRGGPVTSHVRIGENAYSPLIPYGSADIMLAFEPSEAVRNLKYLKPGGFAAVNTVPVMPVMESLKKSGYSAGEMTDYLKTKCSCVFVDSEEMSEKFGSSKFLNIIMIGIAAGSGRLGIEKDVLISEIRKLVPAKFLDVNLEAFETGFSFGMKG